MFFTIIILIGSIVVMLFGATLFTNAIEWLGKRLNVSDGAIGSILAGVGTALPETMIPVVAIFFGTTSEEMDVGIGAIIGAPFMLSTLTLPLLGGGLLFFSFLKKRTPEFFLDYNHVRRDLCFFLCSFSLAIFVTFFPIPIIHYGVALFLILIYIRYIRMVLKGGEHSGDDVAPLYFDRSHHPPLQWVIYLQILVGLGIIVGAAHFFVKGVTDFSQFLGVSPLILSLLITPVATELPEKLNSLIWIYNKKDTLAVGNITGAMVFQSTFPVAIGLVGTPWELDHITIASAGLAILSSLTFYLFLIFHGHWKPILLTFSILFYFAFGVYIMAV